MSLWNNNLKMLICNTNDVRDIVNDVDNYTDTNNILA